MELDLKTVERGCDHMEMQYSAKKDVVAVVWDP
jgi:hypothetical protein